jgi:hypothetical protein
MQLGLVRTSGVARQRDWCDRTLDHVQGLALMGMTHHGCSCAYWRTRGVEHQCAGIRA